MIRDLASNESYRNIGYLDSDLFRDYPNEHHEALRDVVGYDGVEVSFDNGEKFYVAWFDNQMKSSEPTTYDDNGNVIPLSERFKAENNDIRYSLSDNIDKFWKNDYNKDIHYGENLKDTPAYLKPSTDIEWQVFCRSFANKTSDIVSEERKITVFTADHQYLVIADGYMSGRVVSKVNVNLYD